EVGPAFEGERLAMVLPFGDLDRLLPLEILGPARVLDVVRPRGEEHLLARPAVDLGMEEEVGGEPSGLRRVDATQPVADQERRRRRPSVLVADVQDDRDGRFARKEDIYVAAE